MHRPLPDLSELISLITLYNSEDAYKQLFKILYPSIYRFCYCLLKSREMAEETANDVMITLWRKREKLAEIQNIRVYSFVIARNLSLNTLSRAAKQQVLSLDDIKVEIKLETMDQLSS
jgi:RNA polymerase sigma factor (sigma-70 family)